MSALNRLLNPLFTQSHVQPKLSPEAVLTSALALGPSRTLTPALARSHLRPVLTSSGR